MFTEEKKVNFPLMESGSTKKFVEIYAYVGYTMTGIPVMLRT